MARGSKLKGFELIWDIFDKVIGGQLHDTNQPTIRSHDGSLKQAKGNESGLAAT